MKSVEYSDLIGGILLIAVGVFAAVYSQQYAFGTLRNMGPGFFPTVLGVGLAVFGALIALSAMRRTGAMPTIKLRELLCVLSGILCFALLLRSAGLVVTTALTVIICSLADRDTSWLARLVLAMAISALTVLIFHTGLGVNVPLWWR